VAVYDAECPWSRADDFFLSVVNETPTARVLDLGCGTGRLALGMAAAGHTVTGVDPALASLDAAGRKPGAEHVLWIEGTSAILLGRTFDVAVMTSHVAQFFVGDAEWKRALADLKRSLCPGGRLVFDTRDPRGRAWERWNAGESRHNVTLPDGLGVDVWTEITAVEVGAVSFTHHYEFAEGELLSTATLRFRSEDEVRSSLRDAGFTVEHIYGGWNREPIGAAAGELLVIARA
jgi:SAM-dependent methyltransferase